MYQPQYAYEMDGKLYAHAYIVVEQIKNQTQHRQAFGDALKLKFRGTPDGYTTDFFGHKITRRRIYR